MHNVNSALNDEWIIRHRPPKNPVDPSKPYAYLVEKERTAAGRIEDVATVFITNRECPFRCLMCDLWKNTTDEPVASGAVSAQIRWALDRLPLARHIKLYNSGNFFDPGAIPTGDYREIAQAVSSFESVIVESHPLMVGKRCLHFRDLVSAKFEVAMGLETVHPDVLAKLNKRMTTADFTRAAEILCREKIPIRAFLLLRPPFMTESEGVLWAKRSIDFAFDVGVECCVVIPTRAGNGAMEVLAKQQLFHPPALPSLEEVLDYGLSLRRGRVFADLWDIERIVDDIPANAARIERLRRMNLTQVVEPRINAPVASTHAP